MAIVNASNWSPIRAINLASKADLLQELILAEVVDKRHHQLKSLRVGMDYLSLTSLLKRYPDKLRHLFVYQNNRNRLTRRRTVSLIRYEERGLERMKCKQCSGYWTISDVAHWKIQVSFQVWWASVRGVVYSAAEQ